MQLTYKEKWMELQTLKRQFQTHSASDTGMATHLLNFPFSVFVFKLCVSWEKYAPSLCTATQISIVLTISIWKFYLQVHQKSHYSYTRDSDQ